MRAGLLALVLVALAAAPAGAQRNPIFQAPGIPPPGANNPLCKPAAAHPFPVILVHGTFGDMTVSWNTIAPALASRGFCVWALDYGRRGTGPIDRSADQLVAFIDRVRARTGAAKVSLVGHSQGGMLARYVAVRRSRLGVVDDIVGLAPSSHGTTNPLAGPAGSFGCVACAEQRAGSAFMRKVNLPPPEAPGPAWYTVVTTTHDEVVLPFQSQALAGDHATNVILQRECPADHTGHVGIIGDCAGRLELRRSHPRRRYGTRVFGLRTGTAQTLRVRLSRTGARSLARRHRLAVRARALLPRPGGAIAVASRHYRLR